MILTHLQKLPKNVGDLGKLIIARGFKKLPKVQNIAQSGHNAVEPVPSKLLFKYLNTYDKRGNATYKVR